MDDEEGSSGISVKISENFETATLVSKYVNLILRPRKEGVGYKQVNISWLSTKNIIHLFSHSDYFLYVCCKDYDNNLEVKSSFDEEFRIYIPRSIEPGFQTIFEILMMDLIESTFQNSSKRKDTTISIGEQVRILSVRDDEFYIDRL